MTRSSRTIVLGIGGSPNGSGPRDGGRAAGLLQSLDDRHGARLRPRAGERAGRTRRAGLVGAVSTPAWRRLFDAIEGRAAPPIEKGVRTDVFNDTVTVIFRVRRGVQRRVERHTRH